MNQPHHTRKRLTRLQETFAVRIATGDSPAQAARSAGYKASNPRILSVLAQRVLKAPLVRERIQEIRKRTEKGKILTRLRKLELLALMIETKVVDKEQLTTEQLKALEIDNKLQGHNEPDRITGTVGMTLLQLARDTAKKP